MRGHQSRDWLEGHVERLLASLSTDERDQLSRQPRTAVRDIFGVPVTMTDEPLLKSECGLDGLYFDAPPRITVTRARSQGRTNFTILHEVGHHLQRCDGELLGVFAGVGVAGVAVEEDLADALAAELLVPAAFADQLLGPDGPTAAQVVGLFERTEASREACCVRAAQTLSGPGFVVLADLDGTVRFAASAGTPYRIARGTAQPDEHLLNRDGCSPAGRGRERLRYATGTLTPWMHADVVAHGDYVFGVFTEGRPPWGGLSLLPVEGPRGTEVTCARCDEEFEAFGRPCQRCEDHRCAHCGACGCPTLGSQVTRRLCRDCWLDKPAAEFGDDSEVCTSCA